MGVEEKVVEELEITGENEIRETRGSEKVDLWENEIGVGDVVRN